MREEWQPGIGLKGNENLWLHFIFECSKYDMKHNLDIYSELWIVNFLTCTSIRAIPPYRSGQSYGYDGKWKSQRLFALKLIRLYVFAFWACDIFQQARTHSNLKAKFSSLKLSQYQAKLSYPNGTLHKSNICQMSYTQKVRIRFSWRTSRNAWLIHELERKINRNDAEHREIVLNRSTMNHEHQMCSALFGLSIQYYYCICILQFQVKVQKTHRLCYAQMISLAFYIGKWAFKKQMASFAMS